MLKVIILKGLPASGKTTWALSRVSSEPDSKWKRVNKDDLRAMADNSRWSKASEKFICLLRNNFIISALAEGFNVIVDDTNFAPEHEKTIRALAETQGAEVEIKYFDTSVEKCIERDKGRAKPVGERVIRGMYNQYCKPSVTAPKHDPMFPDAIICDIDGTLAKMGDRSPFDWARVGIDTVNKPVAELVHLMSQVCDVFVFSGRDEACRPETKKWLEDNGIVYTKLLMRPMGSTRKDSLVKKELFDEHIRGKYNIKFVLDDRDQVVRMWREELGLTCLQVDYGNF